MRQCAFVGLVGCAVTLAFLACGDSDETTPGPVASNDSGRDGTSADGSIPGNDGGSAADSSIDASPCEAPVFPALRIEAASPLISGALFAAQPPGSSDWYVISQSGVIRIVRDGNTLPTPFLDLTDEMGSIDNEGGLLSIAFHPDYATNGRFFVMGTPGQGNNGAFSPTRTDAVIEFHRSSGNADVAEDAKAADIVVLPASAANHNGGTIRFGKDHFLYVGTGDGGGGCESAMPGVSQDTTKLNGKILRLDVNGAAPYAAAGNPFADDARVLHYGLRNPFRFGFDSLTGDLYIGDVGQDSHEELDFVPSGATGKNFGWPAYEGSASNTCGDGHPLGGPSPHTAPIASISRQGGSFADYRSVIGGIVYRGNQIPSLKGIYVFGDYSGAELGALRNCGGAIGGPVAKPLSSITAPGGLANISAITQGNDGELYISYAGRLGKLVPE